MIIAKQTPLADASCLHSAHAECAKVAPSVVSTDSSYRQMKLFKLYSNPSLHALNIRQPSETGSMTTARQQCSM
eukprot:6058091-Amphidinium_carterae.1